MASTSGSFFREPSSTEAELWTRTMTLSEHSLASSIMSRSFLVREKGSPLSKSRPSTTPPGM